MGKLVRTLTGSMVDMVLDIRKGSPTEGRIIAYDMPASNERDYDEWIWIPPGFAHGNFFTKESNIEYLCTGEYSKGCESGISPLATDINWSLCDPKLKEKFYSLINSGAIISDKDRNAQSLSDWKKDSRSDNFVYNLGR
jgi:dTDP-4-dehydrorhamnose 3,5-epimerase